jgi:hypothetical protein
MEGQVTSLGEELDELHEQYDRTAVCSPAAEQAVVLLDEWEAFLTSLDRWLQTEVGSPEEAAIGQELDTQAIGIEELRIEVERGLAACRATVAAAGS